MGMHFWKLFLCSLIVVSKRRRSQWHQSHWFPTSKIRRLNIIPNFDFLSPRNAKELRFAFRRAFWRSIRIFQIYPLMTFDIQCQILVDKFAFRRFLHHVHIDHSFSHRPLNLQIMSFRRTSSQDRAHIEMHDQMLSPVLVLSYCRSKWDVRMWATLVKRILRYWPRSPPFVPSWLPVCCDFLAISK